MAELAEHERTVKMLRPVFTGKTEEGEEITLYQHLDKPEEIHILCPGANEVVELDAHAEIATWLDTIKNEMRIDIRSSVWVGQARGARWDLLQADR